jgi:homoserine kinase type II
MAVYTEVGEAELDAFLAGYDIGEAEALKGVAEGVENSNYLLTTTRGQYFLTLYEKRVDPRDLPFFLGLMDHLAARGIICPKPIHGRDGNTLRTLAGKPAAITTFLHGLSPLRVAVKHCAPLGRGLAELHLAGQDFAIKRPNALSVAGWRPLFDGARSHADDVAPGLARELQAEIDFFEANWPADLPTGVIHADLFPDNVFFLGDRLSGLIDFYFACTDALAYDLAICLNAWCFEPDGSFNLTKGRLMISRYQSVRPLSGEEARALPLLARGAALRFLLTRLYDWLNQRPGALVKPKDPLEYLAKLRFHQSVRDAASYGLATAAT